MLYRIRIDLAFPIEAPALALFNHAKGFLPQAVTINPGQVNEEKGFIMREACYHDERGREPCDLVEEHTTP